MPVTYRPASSDDIEPANALVVASLNDLAQRHGFGTPATVRRPLFTEFSLQDDPGGLWIAEDAGRIVGFSFSWACDDLWFLAQLFIAPDRQGKGVGGALIGRSLDHAQKANAATRALVTFPFNTVAQGLYISHGLFPRFPLYAFSAAREAVAARLPASPLRAVPMSGAAAEVSDLARIDARALGVSRAKHHRFLRSDPATTGLLLQAGDACVGYAYVSSEGVIGPLAVTEPAHLADAFLAALAVAAGGTASQVSAVVPAPCHAALGRAIDLRMRIVLPLVMMSSRDFGDWRLYMPRNPGFL